VPFYRKSKKKKRSRTYHLWSCLQQSL